MPKVDKQAVLPARDIARVMSEAQNIGTRTFALVAWCYEFGARAAEPGMQLLTHLDLANFRAQPMHLKGGKQLAWHALLPYCRQALPQWQKDRAKHVTRREQDKILFPSEIATGRCYTCAGSGQRPILRRDGEKRWTEGDIKCHHCAGTGKRWGLARQEVYTLVTRALQAAKVPYTHPHVLRHSIISHMLDAGVPPSEVQDRVGHRNLQSTLNYARATPSYGDVLVKKMQNVYGK